MFEKMVEQFKEYSELKDYAESQYKTIFKQSQEITKLQEEVNKLNNLIKQSNIDANPDLLKDFKDLTDQEIICKKQLETLRSKALEGELTLEETKKAEIYTKLLLSIDSSRKQPKSPFKMLTEQELINLAENGTD